MSHSPNRYPVTVVVPIYNVELYIERCAVSLFEQDFDNIEYIFVDDASPDNSVAILQDVIARYPQRADHVQIIRNAENLGLFETRKIGVMAASGEYIQHIDSDDWVEVDMVSTMYAAAKKESADVVACGRCWVQEGVVIREENFCIKNGSDWLVSLLRNEQSVYLHAIWVRKNIYLSIYNKLSISHYINMYEDALLVFPLAVIVRKIYFVPNTFYYYNQRKKGSVTKQYNNQYNLDATFVYSCLFDFLQCRLSASNLRLFQKKAARSLLSASYQTQSIPNRELLSKLSFGLKDLWKSDLFSWQHRVIFSFYFLYCYQLPLAVRKFELRVAK